MTPPPAATAVGHQESTAGLCAQCRYCHHIANAHGSVFHRCRRADSNPAYSRYPRLPMLWCPGFEAGEPTTVSADRSGRR